MIYGVHRDIFGHHFPTEAGRNRGKECNYGARAAPAPELIEGLMAQLIASIQDHLREIDSLPDNQERFELAFEFAAQDHAEMIRIHPFIDGNGRWARILTISFLFDCKYKAGVRFPPASKKEYVAALDRCIDKSAPGHLAELLVTGYELALNQRCRKN